MNLAAFQAEAERLARPGYLLRKIGTGDPAGYWHGIEEGQPCVSFESGSRWLTVTVQGGAGSVSLSEKPYKSDVPLYAEHYVSLPPVDAVFLQGSELVGRFLAEHDWSRTEPFNDNFPGQIAHEYEALWQSNCPLYREI